MSIDSIRASATSLTRTVRQRNIVEYLAAAYVIGRFGWIAVTAHSALVALGATLVSAAGLMVAFQLSKRASARGIAPDLPADRLVAAYRSELCRQRDALSSVALWYLGPFIPGMVLLFAGRTMERAAGRRPAALAGTAVVAFVFAAVWFANAESSKRLQRRIDELDSPASP
jgi:hypothetical protein